MLLGVETESENWIFLKYGRIGKLPIYKVLPYLVIIMRGRKGGVLVAVDR